MPTLTELDARWGFSAGYLARLRGKGIIPAIKVDGRSWGVAEEHVDAIKLMVDEYIGRPPVEVEDSQWITVVRAAKMLDVQPATVYNYLSLGRLSRHRREGRTLVNRAEVEAWREQKLLRRSPLGQAPRRKPKLLV